MKTARAIAICSMGLLWAALPSPLGCGSDSPNNAATTTAAGAGGAGGEDCWWCGDGGSSSMSGGDKSTSSGGDKSTSSGGDKGTGGKDGGLGDIPDCPAGFDPTQPCEGGPKDNYCLFEGSIYYCENGAWQKYSGGK